MKFKSTQMFSFGALAATLVMSFSASATRYIVTFKSAQNYAQAHSQYVLSKSALMNQMFSGRHADVNVEASLTHLQMVIVNSADEALAQSVARGADVVVEKEIILPAPAPVLDFGLTPAWAFDANYSVPAEVLKAHKPKPTKPGTPVDVVTRDNTPWGITAVKAREAWKTSNEGSGARVAVLDTGIDKDHPALKGQIEATQDFVGDNNTPYDVADHVGHGTHVSGTIAALEAADG